MPAKKKIGMGSLMLLLLLPFGDLEVISVMRELKMLETEKSKEKVWVLVL